MTAATATAERVRELLARGDLASPEMKALYESMVHVRDERLKDQAAEHERDQAAAEALLREQAAAAEAEYEAVIPDFEVETVTCTEGHTWRPDWPGESEAHRALPHKSRDWGIRAGKPRDHRPLYERIGARLLTQIDRDPPPPLLVGRIAPEGHTIIFGPGGAGKGLITCSWLVKYADQGGRALVLDFEDHPEEWARRVHGLGGPEAAEAILHVSPFRAGKVEWQDFYEAADKHEASLVVIDSVAYAVPGADPSEAKAATAYSALIQPFGRPVLSLAHMNRAGDLRYPFGSVFWHAGARLTWSADPDAERGTKIQNRKANNYEWQGAYMVTSEWLDGIPRNVFEESFSVTVADRIAEVLADRPLTLDAIHKAINADEGGVEVKRDTVKRTLNRGLTELPKRFTKSDAEHWGLPSDN
jgi:hypothetical protein